MRRRPLFWALPWAVCLLSAAPEALAITRTVDPGQPTSDTNYTTIQSAIDASKNRDVIVVAPGEYRENIDFKGKSLTLKSSAGAATTTIRGTSYAVQMTKGETSEAILQGFTLSSSSYALYTNGSSPKILDSIFSQSSGSYTVYATGSSQPAFQNVQFLNNTTSYTVYADSSAKLSFQSCTFTGNKGVNGGALLLTGASAEVRSSTFTSNSATSNYGGAIYAASNSTLVIEDSTFRGNRANYGGALFLEVTSGRATVRNSRFYANNATYGGLGFIQNAYQVYFSDNVMLENYATDGGTFYLSSGAQTALVNNTIAGPDALRGGGLFLYDGSGTLLLHNIITGATNGEGVYASGTSARVIAWYNDVYDNFKGNYKGLTDQTGLRGNLSVDPQFVNYSNDGVYTNDNLTLATGSPLINAGSTTFKDADGSRADLGAGGAVDDSFSSSGLIVSPLGSSSYRSLTQAISAARNGDTIWLYPGVYYGDVSFAGKVVTVKSAFGVETVVMAGSSYGMRFDNSETSATSLEGVTIWSSGGYGIYAPNSSPTFKNIHLRYCYSSYGIYHANGSPTYIGGRFEDNAPSYTAYLDSGTRITFTGLEFVNNRGANGGALTFVAGTEGRITGSVFEKNRATSNYGGAIYSNGALLLVTDSRFTGNTAPHGGAIFYDSSANRSVVRGSTFQGNTATYGGAIFFNPIKQAHYIDNVFVENAASQGGATYHSSSAQVALINNTMVGNSGPTGGHIFLYSSSNTLLTQNILAQTYSGHGLYVNDVSARWIAWYNDFFDNFKGDFGGAAENVIGVRGNIDTDPEFLEYSLDGDFSNDDLTLDEDSPAIDAGDEEFVDADGSRADLGAGGSDDDRTIAGADFTVSPLESTQYHTVASAISAGASGHKIFVYPGMYAGDINFGGKDLYIKSVFGPETAVIAGGSTAVNLSSTETANSGLEGFTVWSAGGYGLYTSATSPVFKNNHVRYCYSSYGAYHNGGAPTYINMRFEDNAPSYTTFFDGSSKPNISSSSWVDNRSANGGGVHLSTGVVATMTGVTFDSNRASSSYGGAIYVGAATLNLKNGTFIRNQATHGGAVFIESQGDTSRQTTLRDATFFLNKASYGGAFFNNGSHGHLIDAVIVENEATYGGAAYLNPGGHTSFINGTIVGNRAAYAGGLYLADSSNTLITNSIIAFSADGVGIQTTSKAARLLVSFTDVYGNADGEFSGDLADQSKDHGNMTVDPGFNAYSRDGNLANDNLTLKAGSALIDKGLPAFPDKDGSVSDLGAGGGDDERRVSGYDLVVSPLFDSPYRTIAAAVAASSQGKKIGVYPGLYYGDVDPASKTLTISGVYGQLGTVLAGGSVALGLDQGEGSSSSPMLVSGLSIWSAGGYGVNVNGAHLHLQECAIRYCYSSYGAYAYNGTLNLTRTVIENNKPSYPVYYTNSAKGTVTGSTFQYNTASSGGGMFVTTSASVTVTGSRFYYNSASSYGGGIYAYNSGLTVRDTVFQSNQAAHGGGYFQDSYTTATLSGNLFAGNKATNTGGAYYGQNGKGTWNNNILQNNTAGSHGGGGYMASGQSDNFTNNDFIENYTSANGGGLFVYSGASLISVNNIFAHTENGEGLYLSGGITSYDIRYSDFYQNFDGDVAGVISTPPASSLKVDPKFVKYTKDGNAFNDDLHLSSSSSLIDAGDPTIIDAGDGSRSDIGAYGGAGGVELDRDGDGYTEADGDCDDSDPRTYPGAPEVKDGKDNDCNGVVDDPFTDKDGDGYDPTAGDCDDTNPYVNPGAAEKCDGADQDCDGEIDEGAKITFYLDNDGDGYGTSASSIQACAQPAGYSSVAGDCDDSSASIKPSAAEVCDGKDNNCNGQVDEGGAKTYYKDADSDGYGDSQLTQQSCSKPSGYVETPGDCDETDARVNPGASESCNGKDDDCDGSTDEGVTSTWYIDADSDGYGDSSRPTQACSQLTGYVATGGDCNDSTAEVSPAATEVCDSKDNDCDGATDEGLSKTYYSDADGDGYGNTANPTTACTQPANHVTQSGDCDDTRADVKPGATEVCDSVDNDCDGVTDENLAKTWYLDVDSDGYGDASQSRTACNAPTGYIAVSGDCDDLNANVHPTAVESCNQIDDDCDGQKDEGLPQTTYYKDEDGDGYGQSSETKIVCGDAPAGYTSQSGDCDETRAAVNPGAKEACDGLDNDCDGTADEDFDKDHDGVLSCVLNSQPADCNDGDAAIFPGATEVCDSKDNDCDDEVDEVEDGDGDGFTGCGNPPDCDDKNPTAFPGASETCDGADNDCDGEIDEGFDADEDSYVSCAVDSRPADCDDSDPDINPAEQELCDDLDNDCDGEIDEGLKRTWCADEDGDGYGDPDQATKACEAPDGSTANCTDFDDDDASSHPGAPEAPDGVDNDGDGQVDEGTAYYDDDGDGYTEVQDDCDDTNPYVFPGAYEYADGQDNDCDGEIDENVDDTDNDDDGYAEADGDCDDEKPEVHPGATEEDDGVDNDCDGEIDEGTVSHDDDGDGYTEEEGDCDDSEVYTHPGAPEYADGDDNDCDGEVDEELDSEDNDGDGYSESDGDMDDTNPDTYPGAEELPDGLDNDGDGEVDEGTTKGDDDHDGYSEEQGDCDDHNPYVHPGVDELEDNDLDDDCDGQIDEPADGAPVADVELEGTLVDFGEVQVGQRQNASILLHNRGDAALTIEEVVLNDASSPFEVLTDSKVVIPAGGSYTLWFSFAPDSEGAVTATATVSTDDPDEAALEITLEGKGVPGDIQPGDDDDDSPGDDDTPGDDDDDTTPEDPGGDDLSPTPDDGGDPGGCSCSEIPAGGAPVSMAPLLLGALVLWRIRRRAK